MIDQLTRHKWPDDKPEEKGNGGRYLALIDREYSNYITILYWGGDSGWMRYTSDPPSFVPEADVKYWWNLPEVTE